MRTPFRSKRTAQLRAAQTADPTRPLWLLRAEQARRWPLLTQSADATDAEGAFVAGAVHLADEWGHGLTAGLHLAAIACQNAPVLALFPA